MEKVYKSFRDEEGNTYSVERAHNRKWLVIRRNKGGHRKKFPSIEPNFLRTSVITDLNLLCFAKNWEGVLEDDYNAKHNNK